MKLSFQTSHLRNSGAHVSSGPGIMNNLANSLHCEQLGSFHLMVNKEKVEGNFPSSTFEKTGFVTKTTSSSS